MPAFEHSLGLLPQLACYGLLLLEMIVAAIAFRRPPPHAILLWPLAFVLIYVVCLGPLGILLSRAHDPSFDTFNLLSAVVILGLAVLLVYRPNRLAFIAVSCALAFLVVRYVLAFMAPFHGAFAPAVFLLKAPFWIRILIGEIAELCAAASFGSLAIWRPDVFVLAER